MAILPQFSRVSAFPLAAPSWPGEVEFLVWPPAPDVAPALRLEAEWPAWFQVSGRASERSALPALLVADVPPDVPPVPRVECAARLAQGRGAAALPAERVWLPTVPAQLLSAWVQQALPAQERAHGPEG